MKVSLHHYKKTILSVECMTDKDLDPYQIFSRNTMTLVQLNETVCSKMSCDEIPVGKSLNTTIPNIQDESGDLFERMDFMRICIEKYQVRFMLKMLFLKNDFRKRRKYPIFKD